MLAAEKPSGVDAIDAPTTAGVAAKDGIDGAIHATMAHSVNVTVKQARARDLPGLFRRLKFSCLMFIRLFI
jgi:hypothetical protein